MRKPSIAICALVAVLGGCVPTLHPIYTEEDLVFEAALVGTWVEKEGTPESWTFTKGSENEYKVVYVDQKGRKGEFSGHLANVDGQKFLDLFPADPELKANDFYKFHLLPVHTFIRVQQIEPVLKMAMMNPKWLQELLKDNPDAIAHEKTAERILLTAQPKELQAFVIKHATTTDAWGDPSRLRRKADSAKQ